MRLVPAAALPLAFGAGVGAAAVPAGGSGGAIQLQWPLACTPGRDCFVQNYFDRDPGPGRRDHRCGSMTYDGHDGTDIRLPTLADMRRGVAVLAAAPGVVRSVRDGVADISVKAPGAPSVKGRECGNGVLVVHTGGWRTQYCHLKRGSIAVKPGQAVPAGARLGQVGLSGDTEFPHLHLSVRKNGAEVDPFAWDAPAGRCNAGGRSLWAPALQPALAYRSPTVIATGFANGPLAPAAQAEPPPAPGRTTPLVAWVRAIGLETGDVQALSVTGPDGRLVAQSAIPPLASPKAQWQAFAGRKAPPAGWPRGAYRATYAVRRGGKVVLQRTWSLGL